MEKLSECSYRGVEMFLVVQGGFRDGFVITGPFETSDDAIRWALLQRNYHSDILELITLKGFLKTGSYVSVVGDVYSGFKITGTFSSHEAASIWHDAKNVAGKVMALQCP